MRSEGSFAIQSTVLSLISQYGVFFVAALIFFGELGVPTGIPEEVALLLAGAYAVHSVPALLLTLALMTIADIAGTTLLNVAVRTGGVGLLHRVLRRYEYRRPGLVDRWQAKFGRHDVLFVFSIRLLPLVRMYITIASGLLRTRMRDFLEGAAPAALIWAGTPVVLGYVLRNRVQAFETEYSTLSHLILVASPLIGVAGAAIWWLRAHFTLAQRMRQARRALGLLSFVAGTAFLAFVFWVSDRSIANGRTPLPLERVAPGLVLLALAMIALVALGAVDLRSRRVAKSSSDAKSDRPSAEVPTTALYAVLIGLILSAIVSTGVRLALI
jgi:membrane protein DedA with SNARE-associated domain